MLREFFLSYALQLYRVYIEIHTLYNTYKIQFYQFLQAQEATSLSFSDQCSFN